MTVAWNSLGANVSAAPGNTDANPRLPENRASEADPDRFERLMQREAKPAVDAANASTDRPTATLAQDPPVSEETELKALREPDAEQEIPTDWPPLGLAALIPWPAPTAEVPSASALAVAGVGSPPASVAAAPILPALQPGPAPQAGAAGTAVIAMLPASPNPQAAAAQVPAPATALANNPASVNATQANAEGMAINQALAFAKQLGEALPRDPEPEPATPNGNLLGAASTASSLGLARTAVVNPLEAPTPDLHGENFDEAIGSRLTWMAEQKIGHAHIKINPQELGPVEIRLRLDGDRIHADFSSGHSEVRQALEQSLPRLREMLAQTGFQLAHADVGQHHQPQQPAAGHEGLAAGNGDPAGSSSDSNPPPRLVARSLLDAYA